MKISVIVKTKSKKEGVEKTQEGVYLVRVNVPPIDGKANKRVIELLAKYYDCSKSQITLMSGAKGKNKIFKIDL
ncbi:MAG: hypothetical protein CL678_09410 [Bdellovibrionaceae bacterium]|nr:hypothetical protein [Pseudobdellovibrionaceae bacterium]|tara:strand:- start:2141 stop:2362 length:222 start_codon:yes stop_codon:yes gene_type:complete